ncbi:MAG: C45 family peptidase [Thermoguttaceae bacterium]|jgi:hypothetical protein
MKRPKYCRCAFALGFAVLLATPLSAAEMHPYRPGTGEGGQLKIVNGIPVLIVQGSPEEMGRQQAALVGDIIKRLLPLPRLILQAREGDAAWAGAAGVAATIISHASERHRSELDAMAAAMTATADQKASLAVGNVLAELRRFKRCSALLVEPERSATGQVLFGRNYDFATFGVLDRLGLVTVYRPNGCHAFASVGYPASIGVLSGMNDAGLALACLDSGPAKDNSPPLDPRGAPMLLSFRRVLEECATIAEAEKLLRQTRHTTWFNLAVCDREQAVVFEITARHVAVRRSEDHLLASTNHFRTDELGVGARSPRYAKLSEYWKREKPFAWTDVAQAMHDVNMGNTTLQTMVFEPDSLILRLSLYRRPASAGPLVRLELKDLFSPGKVRE